MNRRACLLLAAVATGLCLAMFGLFMPWTSAAPRSVHAQTPPSSPADTVAAVRTITVLAPTGAEPVDQSSRSKATQRCASALIIDPA